MPTVQRFEIVLTAEADVVRSCCGGDHEFGECPLDKTPETVDEADQESEES